MSGDRCVYDDGAHGTCGNEGGLPLVSVCVHEHIERGTLCAEHEWQRTAPGRWFCAECHYGPSSHRCQARDITARSKVAS